MEKSGESSPVILLGKEWFSGGLANAVSSAILNPMDVSKTRLQTEISSIKAGADITKIPRLSTVLVTLYKEGGLIGLWKPGLTASVAREFLNSGPRAGLYVPVRKQIVAMLGMQDEVNESSFLPKVLAAICTGTIGAIVANPVDVVKIRLMVNSTAYSSLISGVFHVYKQEGIYGLYKGLVPSTLRAAFIAVGELATYDHSKTILKKYVGMQEGSYLHTTASLITGFVAATVAAPFDLIKTRTMNADKSLPSMTAGRIFIHTVKNEGIMVLFRGWLPSYLRLGPHALICFPIFEQIRILMGLEYL